MKAEVRTDETTRTIHIRVTGADPIENRLGRTYQKVPRPFRPDDVLIELVDGSPRNILVTGSLVLKDGTLSATRDDRDYWVAGDIADAPDWVQTLWREAADGTSWTFGEDA